MTNEIESAVKVFEEIQKVRIAQQTRLTHLKKNRTCLDCGRDWMPRRFQPCPSCHSENTRITSDKRKCLECGYQWEPVGVEGCPSCGSINYKPNPIKDPYISEIALPRIIVEEAFYRSQMQAKIRAHPLWDWASQVLGVGEINIGRIISRTDIRRCNTVSEMWAHCGFGLDTEGKPQRKIKGRPIDYNPQLRGNCVMLGQSLLLRKDTYYSFYLIYKNSREGLPAAHAHNHGFRLMIKLFLAHMWEIWRESEGLPAPEPYAFAILKHPSDHLIKPWEMVRIKKQSSKKRPRMKRVSRPVRTFDEVRDIYMGTHPMAKG